MPNKYWNNTEASSKYHELYSKFVPDNGKCDTLVGELLRAGGRINYDFFNNGNCNNTSGANLFLQEHLPDQSDAVKKALRAHYDECNTGGYTDVDLSESLDVILDHILEYVSDQLDNSFTLEPSPCDLFELQEPDYAAYAAYAAYIDDDDD